MSQRWRERKGGSFVSASELAARKKALLAPVEKFHKAWVQPNPSSPYRVLKWVPRSHPDPPNYDDPSAIDGSDSGSSESDDDEDEDDPEGAGEGGDPASGPGEKPGRRVRDAERSLAGQQLAGLETGETAEDVADQAAADNKFLSAVVAGGESTSGTATPLEKEVPRGMTALGGLDGGAAARVAKLSNKGKEKASEPEASVSGMMLQVPPVPSTEASTPEPTELLADKPVAIQASEIIPPQPFGAMPASEGEMYAPLVAGGLRQSPVLGEGVMMTGETLMVEGEDTLMGIGAGVVGVDGAMGNSMAASALGEGSGQLMTREEGQGEVVMAEREV